MFQAKAGKTAFIYKWQTEVVRMNLCFGLQGLHRPKYWKEILPKMFLTVRSGGNLWRSEQRIIYEITMERTVDCMVQYVHLFGVIVSTFGWKCYVD